MPKGRTAGRMPAGVRYADDDELMNRYQHHHDSGALEELFVRHKDILLRYISRLIRDASAAEDAFQMSWLKVIEVAHKRSYVARPDAAFRTWLCTLARNHVIDEHRRRLKFRQLIAVPETTGVGEQRATRDGVCDITDPADEAVQRDLNVVVSSAVHLLPPAQRDVITLWAAGFGPQDIARIQGVPRQTVFSRKKNALAKLRTSVLAAAPQSRSQWRC
jgi:RNA polymerase sigma factor (sigma-70 family)